jgi:hypothetical protein
MTIAYIDVAKAPVQVPVIDLLGEPQGAAFDFINGKAWIVDKVHPANSMLRDIGDVLVNPGASTTKMLRRKSGKMESAPWWENEFDLAGNPMGMRVEAQRTRLSRYPAAFDNAAWFKIGTVVTPTGQPGIVDRGSFKLASTAARPRLQQNVNTLAPVWVGYVIVEAAEWQYATIGRGNGSGVWTCLTFDLQTGQFVNRSGASTQPTLLEYGSIDMGGGRWLLWMRTDEQGAFYVGPAFDASGYLFSGGTWPHDGVSGIIVHFMAQEDGPFPTSLNLMGETAAATRATDQVQIAAGFIPFNTTDGTLIIDAMSHEYDDDLNQRTFGFRASSTNYAHINRTGTGARVSRLNGGSRNVNANGVELPTEGSFPVFPNPRKVGLTYATDFTAIASGVSAATAEIAVGHGGSLAPTPLQFMPGGTVVWYRSAIYIPRRLTANELLQRVRA